MKPPRELQLDEQQLAELAAWRKEVIQPIIDAMSEDDLEELSSGVTPASPFTYKLYATGLGTVIWVEGLGRRCDLSIDDDGKLYRNWSNL